MELEPEVVVAKEGVTVNEQLESKQNHVMLCAIAAIVIVCTCSVIQSYSKGGLFLHITCTIHGACVMHEYITQMHSQ